MAKCGFFFLMTTKCKVLRPCELFPFTQVPHISYTAVWKFDSKKRFDFGNSSCRVKIYHSGFLSTHLLMGSWDKKDVVRLYNRILLDHQKKKNLLFVTAWMDLEIIMLSEISQSEKDKYHTISLICGIKLTKLLNKQNRNRSMGT